MAECLFVAQSVMVETAAEVSFWPEPDTCRLGFVRSQRELGLESKEQEGGAASPSTRQRDAGWRGIKPDLELVPAEGLLLTAADIRRDLFCQESQDLGLPGTSTLVVPALNQHQIRPHQTK